MLEDDSFQATLGYQTKVPVMMIENENSVAGRQVASGTVTTVAGPGTGSHVIISVYPRPASTGAILHSGQRKCHTYSGFTGQKVAGLLFPRCSLPGLLAT